LAIAELCEAHPAVRRVFYPGLESHAQHSRAADLFRNFGSIMSIDLIPGVDCFEVLNALQTVVSSSNLGDTRTLAIPVAHTIFYEMGSERRASMGISDSMIRFSVGIEDQEDLLTDFTQALNKAQAV
jgi:O-acetylhomoserine (thiol)-lyase